MTTPDQFEYSGNNAGVQELTPFGSTTADTLPSLGSILGAGNDEGVENLSAVGLSRKIGAINGFYEGLKSPYVSAQALMRSSLVGKREQVLQVAGKKEKKSLELEIEELEDGLNWSIKKINVLEEERKMLISGLK